MVKHGEVKSKPNKSDLRIRIITSVIILSLILPIFVLPAIPQWNLKEIDIFFSTLLTVVFGYAVYEISMAAVPMKSKGDNTHMWSYLLTLPFTMLFATLTLGRILGLTIPTWVVFLSIFVTFMFYIATTSMLDTTFTQSVIVGLVSMLLMFFFGTLVYTAYVSSWNVMLWPIVVAALADTFAYFGGKKFGKHHPFPNVSPNKTTEGLVIGVTTAIVVGISWYFGLIWTDILPESSVPGFDINIPIWAGIVFSIVPALIGPMGDLFFSKAKRNLDIKDFGTILPGHGGLLDRIDSHVFATTLTILPMFALI